MHFGNSAEFGLWLENSANIDHFSFSYQSTFNRETFAIGQTILIESDENIFTDPGDNVDGVSDGSGGTYCDNLVYYGLTESQISRFCGSAQLAECVGTST